MIKRFSLLFISLLLLGVFSGACRYIAVQSPETSTPSATPASVDTKVSQTPTVATITTSETKVEPVVNPQQLPDVDPADLVGLEVSIIHPWVNEAELQFEKLIEEFNGTNPWGIKVFPNGIGGYEAVAGHLAEQGLNSDLVISRGFDLAPLAKDSQITDLRPYILDLDYGVENLYDPNSVLGSFTPDTKNENAICFLPLGYRPAILFYNQDWATELGFERPPTTPLEFKTQLLAGFNANLADMNLDNNGTGGLLVADSPYSGLSWYRAFSGEIDPELSIPSFNNPAGEASFTYLKTLFEDDASWTGFQSEPYEYFTKRLTLAYEGTLAYVSVQERIADANAFTDKWITIPYPTEDGRGSLSLETVSVAIRTNTSEKTLAAWILVQFLLSAEAQEALVTIHSGWPVTADPLELAPDYASQHPAWATALTPGVRISLAPEEMNWAFSRLILQDAVRRIYSLDAEFIPTVLDLLDQTLIEVEGIQADE